MGDVQKNLFWVVIGVVFLAELAGYFVLVRPKQATIEETATDLGYKVSELSTIADLVGPEETRSLMTEQWLEHYEAKAKRWQDEHKRIHDFYKARDYARLERFFDALGIDVEREKDKVPESTAFNAVYREQMNTLLAQVQAAGAEIGSSDGKSGGFQEDKISGEADVRAIQKNFWIERAIADAVIEARATKVVRVSVNKPQDMALNSFQSIGFNVEVHLPFPRVAIFVDKLLKSELPVQVQSLRVEALKDQIVGEQTHTQTFEQGELEKARTAPDDDFLPDRAVRLTLSGEVLDYHEPPAEAPPPSRRK